MINLQLGRAVPASHNCELAPAIARKMRVRPKPPVQSCAKVTVVIPCYNYQEYLIEAINSSLSQVGVDVDVVIVDDASTDNSFRVMSEAAAQDDRITVVRHTKNAGPVQTFNDGLALARGEFLVRLDADDLLTPGALRRAVDVMRQFPSVGLVYGHPIHFRGQERPVARTKSRFWTVWPGREWLADRCATGFNVITSPEAVMRRSVVDRLGGQEDLAHTHDMEMWLRLSGYCDVAYIGGVDQAWHREHSRSLSATKVDELTDFNERRAAFEVLFKGPTGLLHEAPALRKSATIALARYCVEASSRLFDHRTVDTTRLKLMMDAARELVDDVETIPGWKGLRARIAVGPGMAAFHPRFLAERIGRGLLFRWRRLRWHRCGY